MNKFKIVTRNHNKYLCVKSQKGQQLNMNEVEVITNRKVVGLLHTQVQHKGSGFKLDYNITGYITLSEYLRSTLNKPLFAMLLGNIFTIFQNMQTSHFSFKNLLLNQNQIFVDPASKNIFFVFLPIQYFDNCTSVKDFYLSIAGKTVFASDDNTDYVKEYIRILNSGINFSVFELEQYIAKLSGKQTSDKQKQNCKKCDAINTHTSQFCNSCGTNLKQEKSVVREDTTYDPLNPNKTKKDEIKEEVAPEPPVQEKNEKVKAVTENFSGVTTVLGDANGTTVLGAYEEEEPTYPYLIREKSQENISVNKPVFRIGKEKQYTDLFVSDNSAVSRSHADIITKDGRFYIVDKNSTNKTYLDERAIPPEKEVEIFSGMKIRLANEDFIFYV